MLSLHTSQVGQQAGAYQGFCSMKRFGVFLLPLHGMLVHRRVTPSSPVSIYTPGWREAMLNVLPKNTTRPRPVLDRESTALTMTPPRRGATSRVRFILRFDTQRDITIFENLSQDGFHNLKRQGLHQKYMIGPTCRI